MAHLTSPYASMSASLYIPTDREDKSRFVKLDEFKYCCLVCHQLLQEPVQTECGHRMCKKCVVDKLEEIHTDGGEGGGGEGFKCPAAEEDCVLVTKNNVNPDFSVIREINNLEVHCDNIEYGCTPDKRKDKLTLRKLKGHLEVCEFKPVECRYCGTLGKKDLMLQHEKNCDERPVTCPHCKKDIPKSKLEKHKTEECPELTVTCPQGCGKKNIKRAELEEHLTKNCPSVCKFYSMGCDEKGSPQHMAEHEKKDTAKHIDLLMVYMAKLKLDNSKLRADFDNVNDELETVKTQLAVKDTELDSKKRQLSQVESQLQEQQASLEKHVKQYTEQMASLESRLSTMDVSNRQMAGLQQSQANIDTGLKDANTAMRGVAGAVNVPANFDAQFVEHGSALQEHTLQLDKLSLRLQCVETTSYDGTLVWKISEFTRRRREARDGKMVSLYSQPFYTHKFGYKMCARIYLNGDGVGRGKYVSLFFVLMKGDFDDILAWPFEHRVTMMLLNQKDPKKHLSDTFRPDLTSSSFQKPVTNLNIASGCPMFASHEALEKDDSYTLNDSIFIKVVVDLSKFLAP